jgi:DNA-directed RNA polymerase specialized sigma24 family protein
VENLLTQTGFDKLLSALDADRELAGAKYESLRARLVKFFEWRNCETPEELTDTVFDRVAKKIVAGEQIQNVGAYAATVAQFVLKEDCRSRVRLVQSIEDHPGVENLASADGSTGADEVRLDCFEECLSKISAEDRRLVTAYYDTDERTMMAMRKRLAEASGVSLNTLRIRVCRLKAKLEDCTLDCCRRGEGSKFEAQGSKLENLP